MDHIPYPLTSDLLGFEIPLLCRSEVSPILGCNESAPCRLQSIEIDICDVDTYCGASNKRKVKPLTEGRPFDHGHPEAVASVGAPAETFEDTDWINTFWRYPEQQGWLTNSTQLQWLLCSNEEAALRAQQWLYLRLLSNFLGVRIQINTLSKLSTSTGNMVIDSSALPHLIQDWELKIRQGGGGKQDMNGERLSQVYTDRVFTLLKRILAECNKLDQQLEPSRSISFSIKILVETLAQAIWHVTEDYTAKQWKIWKLGPTTLLEERMAQAGWCRFQIAKLWYQYLPSTVYYLSSLPSRTTFGGSPHPACTADHCTSSGVDPITYEPQHRKSCPSQSADGRRCSMVGVNTTRVADIILQGSIPLIEIRLQIDGTVVLDVVPHDSSLRYVAISHVWSGGLGNITSNAMRSCQLRYLHRLLLRIRENGDDDLDRRQGSRKLQDALDDARLKWGFGRKRMPLYLWIDTLCVPVGLSHKDAYNKTLYRMAQIYLAAQCVLVLDPELQNLNHRLIQKEQTFAHILCSAWMSRSWTFQEACMARIWFVQFADGYFIVDKQYFEFQKASEKLDQKTEDGDSRSPDSYNLSTRMVMSEPRIQLMLDVSYWFREMPVIAKIRNRDPRELMHQLEDWKNFSLAWNGLRNRSTTKADDLYGILAVVVDLSAGEILKVRPEDRLKAILRSQTTLPLPLLYQAGPKLLDDKGIDTWAPSEIRGDRLELQAGYLTFGPQGLFLDPGQWIDLSKPQAVLVASSSKSSRFLNVEIPEMQATRTIEHLGSNTSPRPENAGDLLCYLFDETLVVDNAAGLGTFAPGACLLIHAQKDSVYQGSYICPIRLFTLHPPTSNIQSPLREKADVLPVTLSGTLMDWQKNSIIIQSDLTSWPSPSPHVSKRSASKLVIIRNASIWCQLSYNAIAQGPYLVAFGVCYAHRRSPIPWRLSWLFLSRWLGIVIESFWEGAILFVWDHRRAVRWSERLYGTFTKSRRRRLKDFVQSPVPIAKVLLLSAGLVFTGLYCSHGESWMKVFAIILLCDVGISTAYISLLIYLCLKYVKGQYRPFTLNVFTNLPEDPFERSDTTLRFWEQEMRPDVDHRYPIAIMAWRIVDYVRRKERVVEDDDRIVSHI